MAQVGNSVSVIGCGWLGLPLAQALIKIGYDVKGTTTTPSKLSTLKKIGVSPFLFNLYDIISPVGLEELLDVDQVVINIPPGRNNPDVQTAYPEGMSLLMRYIKQSKCSRVIYISTTGVYPNINDVVTETYPPFPVKPSSEAVYVGEELAMATGINHVILRMSGLVGGSRQPGRWFAGKRGLSGGDTPVNMVHLDDCLSIITTVLTRSDIQGLFNVTADLHPPKQEFYKVQSNKLGLIPPEWLKGYLPYKVVSNQKIKDTLNYEFIHKDPCQF